LFIPSQSPHGNLTFILIFVKESPDAYAADIAWNCQYHGSQSVTIVQNRFRLAEDVKHFTIAPTYRDMGMNKQKRNMAASGSYIEGCHRKNESGRIAVAA
jgi:hypothetical protein